MEIQVALGWGTTFLYQLRAHEHGSLYTPFFQHPQGVVNMLDYYRSIFFWPSNSENKKYRLAKWSMVCQPKDHRGLRIHDLTLLVKHDALLSKWLYKLLTEEGI